MEDRINQMVKAAQEACTENLRLNLEQGFFTSKETEKIYSQNFDTLVIAKSIDYLQKTGHDWLSKFLCAPDQSV